MNNNKKTKILHSRCALSLASLFCSCRLIFSIAEPKESSILLYYSMQFFIRLKLSWRQTNARNEVGRIDSFYAKLKPDDLYNTLLTIDLEFYAFNTGPATLPIYLTQGITERNVGSMRLSGKFEV